jgi:hypothetical protein
MTVTTSIWTLDAFTPNPTLGLEATASTAMLDVDACTPNRHVGHGWDRVYLHVGPGCVFAQWLVLKSAFLSMFYIIILHLKYQ